MKKAHIDKKKRAKYIGRHVCCCDLKHRTIAYVDKYWTAHMTDGLKFSVPYCVTLIPALDDNSCHAGYWEDC